MTRLRFKELPVFNFEELIYSMRCELKAFYTLNEIEKATRVNRSTIHRFIKGRTMQYTELMKLYNFCIKEQERDDATKN